MHFIFLFAIATLFSSIYGENLSKEELTQVYELYRTTPSDISEHLPKLKSLASECSSVVEIGRRSIGSTWALLTGLSENDKPKKSYLEIELAPRYLEKYFLTKRLAHENGISFQFIQDNDINVDLEENVDLLFIDSIHTYCHLTYELEKYSPQVNKYIVMHDTSPPWGYFNDTEYTGNYSEYPPSIDRSKAGLSTAVNDFLEKNKGWTLLERRFNNHGLVILQKVKKATLSADPKIHLFIHACTITHWKNVLDRQLSHIKASGLYDAAESINLGVLGNQDVSYFKEKFPKINILFQEPNMGVYERPTLLALHDLALKNPTDALVLYMHTKGVTRTQSTVTDWTLFMEYFLIEKWRDCVAALQKHDICGVNWQLGPKPHFSGNFWWATSPYLLTLPHYIKEAYLDPEMWIGQNQPNYHCFHYSNVDHYHEPYPVSLYASGHK